jgi:hypothetical protein
MGGVHARVYPARVFFHDLGLHLVPGCADILVYQLDSAWLEPLLRYTVPECTRVFLGRRPPYDVLSALRRAGYEVYLVDGLHAKLVLVGGCRRVIIGSANFTARSLRQIEAVAVMETGGDCLGAEEVLWEAEARATPL